MSDGNDTGSALLPPLPRHLDQVCDRFETAWKQVLAGGPRPRLQDFLAGSSAPQQQILLLELLTVESGYRRQLGERPAQAEYQRRFPEVPAAWLAGRFGPEEGTVDPERHRRGSGADEAAAGPPRIGRYLVEEEIGRGAMGQVLRLRDEEFGRPLAMKVLLPAETNQDALAERFLKEAHLTGRLQHPGIPPVHDLGRLPDGRPYFVMKLIQGRSLHALLRERAAPAQDLARWLGIFEHVCQTLAYSHDQGVIHRDLKPTNVMVGAFGEVQVMDWGLAKVLRRPVATTDAAELPAADPDRPVDLPEESPLPSGRDESTVDRAPPGTDPGSATKAGAVLGTPAYMAPEQARGEVDTLDERCDVFGLGAILCEILTGRPPFATGSAKANLQLGRRGDLAEAFTRLDGCGADAELVDLAKHCLAAAPADRPPQAGAVAAAVAQYQAEVQARLQQAEMDKAAAEARAAEEQKRRQAEQARAQAEQARAEEEKKRREVEQARARTERQRRRLTVALAALAVVFVIAGSAFGVWYALDQAARTIKHDRLEEDIAGAVEQAQQGRKKLLAQLAAPGGVRVLLNKPSGWKQQINTCRAAWQRARERINDADRPIQDELLSQMATLEGLLDRDDADFQLARERKEDAARCFFNKLRLCMHWRLT
jgi:serine/threonine protein kinase